MLIDDNPDDNYFHQRVIEKNKSAREIRVIQSAEEALEFLTKQPCDSCCPPDLILLDVNMPRMNGWEFLNEYSKLPKNLRGKGIVVMLTTSNNPDDLERSKSTSTLSGFLTKPLTKTMLNEILAKHFG
jgi:CheY-like chemotaxis protein